MPALSSTFFLTTTNNTVRFRNDNYGEVLALNQGNVGIGTASPGSKLQIDLASGITGTVGKYSDLAANSRVTLSSASSLNDKVGFGAAFASLGTSIPAGFVFGREG